MQTRRIAVIAGGCAAIVGTGWVFAPRTVPEVTTTGGPTAAGEQVFDGPVITNVRGAFQVEIVVANGVVTEVRPLKAGTPDATSRFINQTALPELEQQMIAAQTWKVNYVSGASYTSDGIIASAKAAFAQAGLG